MLAVKNGADQLELCADLKADGLTPDLSLCKAILNKVKIPVKVMLRSRGGNFVYTASDIKHMLEQLKQLKTLSIQGVVFGALKKDNSLDFEAIAKIAKIAYPLPITIHKCIDQVDDFEGAINKLKKIPNVKFILSSGLYSTALLGVDNLLKMKRLATPEIKIIAAGKVRSDNLSQLHSILNLEYYHGKKIVQ